MRQTTTHPKSKEMNASEKWFILDAEGKVLGQVATRLADVLRGKHKPDWHPSLNCGDHVVVINAEKVVLTGSKELKKDYIHHTGFRGGIKMKKAGKMRIEKPERMIELAVTGMIPRNRIRQFAIEKLHVYAGTEHPHNGQNPKPLSL